MSVAVCMAKVLAACSAAEESSRASWNLIAKRWGIILDCTDLYAFLRTCVEDRHYHEHVPAHTGNFGTNQQIGFFHSAKGLSEFAFLPMYSSGNRFRDPMIYGQGTGRTPLLYLKFLIFKGLHLSRDPDISVDCHCDKCC